MATIFSTVVEIKDLENLIIQLFVDKYRLQNSNLKRSVDKLKQTINELKPDLFVCIEHPYVDRAYRDSYYKYYASKRDEYSRDTIRLSFFAKKIEDKDFRMVESQDKLQQLFLGFIVIRPTFPNIIGRSVLDPKALLRTNISICKVSYKTTVNSIKLIVNGFPHSSQDQETISCAETTVWSLLEYFGNKYPEYRPVLPTQVNEILGKFSSERLIPSSGLTAGQISYALKEFGFGVKIYSKKSYSGEFEKTLRVYVESGIPVVGLIQNNLGVGHALNIVGRENLTQDAVDNLAISTNFSKTGNTYEFENLDLKYVFVDDNYPPYQITDLKNPASYYSNPKWAGCELTNFIVPLYPKIYLEAGEAKTVGINLLKELNFFANKDVLIKTFLASSRSYKNYVALNASFTEDIKELLLGTSMPKFIWIMELSDKNLIISNQASGMVILDATEPKRLGLISALIDGEYIYHDLTTLKKITLPLQPFFVYSSNLN